MTSIRIPRNKMTCWELCGVIEREVKGLGSSDNTPVVEMALEEQAVLLNLLGHIENAKGLLNRIAHLRDEHDGGFPRCTDEEGCECAACISDRIRFNEWCDNTEERWEKARREGKVAHACGVLCPEHGDVRDTSIDVVREAAVR